MMTALYFSNKRWGDLSRVNRFHVWESAVNRKMFFIPPYITNSSMEADEDLDEILFWLSLKMIFYVWLFFCKSVLFNLKLVRLIPYRNMEVSKKINNAGYSFQKKYMMRMLMWLWDKPDVIVYWPKFWGEGLFKKARVIRY